MNRIGQFYKVSFRQFEEGWADCFGGEARQREDCQDVQAIYERIALPRRATKGSAGYDFVLPCPVTLAPGETIKIPTGIRVRMEEGWLLALFPRSGLGFKYRMQMNNTVGIVDSDYYGSDNEGHIFAKITNDSNEGLTMKLEAGTAFMQGIFLPFGITEDDQAETERNGGFGSTDRE